MRRAPPARVALALATATAFKHPDVASRIPDMPRHVRSHDGLAFGPAAWRALADPRLQSYSLERFELGCGAALPPGAAPAAASVT